MGKGKWVRDEKTKRFVFRSDEELSNDASRSTSKDNPAPGKSKTIPARAVSPASSTHSNTSSTSTQTHNSNRSGPAEYDSAAKRNEFDKSKSLTQHKKPQCGTSPPNSPIAKQSWRTKLKNRTNDISSYPPPESKTLDDQSKEQQAGGYPASEGKLVVEQDKEQQDDDIDPSLPAWKRSLLLKKKSREGEKPSKSEPERPSAPQSTFASTRKPPTKEVVLVKNEVPESSLSRETEDETTSSEKAVEEESQDVNPDLGQPEGKPLMAWQSQKLKSPVRQGRAASQTKPLMAWQYQKLKARAHEEVKNDNAPPERMTKFKSMNFKKEEEVLEVSGKQDPALVCNRHGTSVVGALAGPKLKGEEITSPIANMTNDENKKCRSNSYESEGETSSEEEALMQGRGPSSRPTISAY